jgi:hypothetical protein
MMVMVRRMNSAAIIRRRRLKPTTTRLQALPASADIASDSRRMKRLARNRDAWRPAPEGAAETGMKGTFVPCNQAAQAAFVVFLAAPSGAGIMAD